MVIKPATLDAGHMVKACDRVGGKKCSEDVADQAANSVHREDVQGIVNAKDKFKLGGIVGERGAENAVDNSRPDWDVTFATVSVRASIYERKCECED